MPRELEANHTRLVGSGVGASLRENLSEEEVAKLTHPDTRWDLYNSIEVQ